jgi:glutathione S-transferase
VTWRLITIRPSHYNEKARWALDRLGFEYDEEPWLPVLHFAGTAPVLLPRRVGEGEKDSTRFSTPVLVAGGRVIPDSSAIAAFASRSAGDPAKSLYWSTEAIELDRHFSGRFGADTRRLAYFHLLPHDDLLVEVAERSVGPRQVRAFVRAMPLIRRTLSTILKIDERHAAHSRDNVLAEFERVGERLADGRPYLLGDRFSAADLSFSALAAVAMFVQPEEGYGAWLPPPAQVSSAFAALSDELRATPAGAFALRMFAEERGRRLRPCAVGRS